MKQISPTSHPSWWISKRLLRTPRVSIYTTSMILSQLRQRRGRSPAMALGNWTTKPKIQKIETELRKSSWCSLKTQPPTFPCSKTPKNSSSWRRPSGACPKKAKSSTSPKALSRRSQETKQRIFRIQTPGWRTLLSKGSTKSCLPTTNPYISPSRTFLTPQRVLPRTELPCKSSSRKILLKQFSTHRLEIRLTILHNRCWARNSSRLWRISHRTTSASNRSRIWSGKDTRSQPRGETNQSRTVWTRTQIPDSSLSLAR